MGAGGADRHAPHDPCNEEGSQRRLFVCEEVHLAVNQVIVAAPLSISTNPAGGST